MIGAVAALATLAILGTQFGGVQSGVSRLGEVYRLDANAPLVTPDEIALLGDVERLVPDDALIADNPWDGSALAYAYTGRPVLFPHLGGRYPESYWQVSSGLSDAAPDACAAANELGVGYLLDFGGRAVFRNDARAELYPGFEANADSPALTLLAERGDARLYEVTGC